MQMVATTSQNGKQDFSLAIAGMAFSDARIKNTQWYGVLNYI